MGGRGGEGGGAVPVACSAGAQNGPGCLLLRLLDTDGGSVHCGVHSRVNKNAFLIDPCQAPAATLCHAAAGPLLSLRLRSTRCSECQTKYNRKVVRLIAIYSKKQSLLPLALVTRQNAAT